MTVQGTETLCAQLRAAKGEHKINSVEYRQLTSTDRSVQAGGQGPHRSTCMHLVYIPIVIVIKEAYMYRVP